MLKERINEKTIGIANQKQNPTLKIVNYHYDRKKLKQFVDTTQNRSPWLSSSELS
jgi:hypothetical protein